MSRCCLCPALHASAHHGALYPQVRVELRELEEKVMMAEKMERMEKEKLELEEKMLEAERRAQVRLMAL